MLVPTGGLFDTFTITVAFFLSMVSFLSWFV